MALALLLAAVQPQFRCVYGVVAWLAFCKAYQPRFFCNVCPANHHSWRVLTGELWALVHSGELGSNNAAAGGSTATTGGLVGGETRYGHGMVAAELCEVNASLLTVDFLRFVLLLQPFVSLVHSAQCRRPICCGSCGQPGGSPVALSWHRPLQQWCRVSRGRHSPLAACKAPGCANEVQLCRSACICAVLLCYCSH